MVELLVWLDAEFSFEAASSRLTDQKIWRKNYTVFNVDAEKRVTRDTRIIERILATHGRCTATLASTNTLLRQLIQRIQTQDKTL